MKVLGYDTLKNIARERIETVGAKLRVIVKRILRKYGYTPYQQEKAIISVLQLAELIAKDWVGLGD